jgi:hypothetical protein
MKRILVWGALALVAILAVGCRGSSPQETVKVVTSEVTRVVTREVTRLAVAPVATPGATQAVTVSPSATPHVVERQVTVLVVITTTPAPEQVVEQTPFLIVLCNTNTPPPPAAVPSQMRVDITGLPLDKVACCSWVFIDAAGRKVGAYQALAEGQVLPVPRTAQYLRLEGSADGQCPWTEYTTVLGGTQADRIPLASSVLLRFTYKKTPVPFWR